MARESNPVEEHESSSGGHAKRDHKRASDLAAVPAEKEKEKKKMKEKKRKRTKDPISRDAEGAKPESKHKRRKKDKDDKLPSAKKNKDGKISKKKRKSEEKGSRRGSTASSERLDDTGDVAVGSCVRKGEHTLTKPESAPPSREEHKIEKKKKKKEKRRKKTSSEDSEYAEDTLHARKETLESQDADDSQLKSRKRETKKRKKGSDGAERRKSSKGNQFVATSEPPDNASAPTANGTIRTSEPDAATINQEEEPLSNANGSDQMVSMQSGEHKDEMDGGQRMASVSDMLKKASQKRNGYLHGPAAIPLLSVEQVRSLDKNGRHDYIKKSAALSHQLVHLMHNIVVKANEWVKIERSGDLVDIEEALTRDMARFRTFPVAKQYVSMTLWRRIRQMTRDHLHASSKIGFGKGYAEPGMGEDQGLLLHREGDPDAEFVSYKEAYMKDFVERHQQSLDTLREREQMDETRVRFLLRCLDAGSSLAANLRCIEKNIGNEQEGHAE